MKCNHLLSVSGMVVLTVLFSNSVMASDKLDDATIFAIFDQANSVDIYTGQLGAKYGHSEEVRALGRMVVADHVAVQQMGRDLAKKLNIVPTPPEHDTSVADQAKAVSMLQSVTGKEFDKAYLRHEIAFHQSVITAIRKTLLPAIHNSEFKKLVNEVLPGFEHHLDATRAEARHLGIE
jgi:putative membrane protein